MSEELKKPILGRASSTEDAIAYLSAPDTMQEMAWALRDWAEASAWLTERGVPAENEHGNWADMSWRFEWYIQNVLPEGGRDYGHRT